MATVCLTPEDKADIETGDNLAAESAEGIVTGTTLAAEGKADITTGTLLAAQPVSGLVPLGEC